MDKEKSPSGRRAFRIEVLTVTQAATYIVPDPPHLSNISHDILAAAMLLMESGAVHEVRIPKAGRFGTVSGYFDSPLKVAEAVEEYDGKVPAIFITLNPVNPELLARADNRLKPYMRETSADTDVTRRRWLLIDCDPERPSGISSTDEEHGRAITTACGIWDDLRSAGWPDPVVADSGNGAHLLYRIDLPNDPTTTSLLKRILKGIADRCAPDDVKVDVAVYNSARITKLYGTTTCKGDSTTNRPHRRSRILEVPDPLRVLKLEVLQ